MGASNGLPWKRDMPADLWHFRQLTIGTSAIMGYHTYQSMGGPLVGRENIVVTSRQLPCGILTATSLQNALEKATRPPVVIGGAQLYEDALHQADIFYATEIKANFPTADRFFPILPSEFTETDRVSHVADTDNKYDFDFVTYQRTS